VTSKALANARDLYNQAKRLIDAGKDPYEIEQLLILARLSADIAKAEALQAIADAIAPKTVPRPVTNGATR